MRKIWTGKTMDSTEKLKVSIIICTYKREEYLKKCVESIVAQTFLPFEVIIIDDDAISPESQDVFKQLIEENKISYQYIRKDPSKKGLTRSRNIGIQHAGGHIVMFLDDDVEISTNYIREIMAIFIADKECAIGGVGGYDNLSTKSIKKRFGLMKLFHLDSRIKGIVLKSAVAVHFNKLTETEEVEFLLGYNMAFRKSVFNRFRFEEVWGENCDREDVEFSYRVSRHFRLLMTPQAKLVHKQAPQAIFRGASSVKIYMNIFNRFFLFYNAFYSNNKCLLPLYVWSYLGWILYYCVRCSGNAGALSAAELLQVIGQTTWDITKILLNRTTFKEVYRKLELNNS